MKKTLKSILSLTLVLALVLSLGTVFVSAESNDGVSNQVDKKPIFHVTKETTVTDEKTGVVQKTIDFSIENYNLTEKSIQSNDITSQSQASSSVLNPQISGASGTLYVSLTPDTYGHYVEIDYRLNSSVPLMGFGTMTCLMDGSSNTKVDFISGYSTYNIYGQFNYQFSGAGAHLCDVICSFQFVDEVSIVPTTGWIPFSV
jgi:hypothetical protein